MLTFPVPDREILIFYMLFYFRILFVISAAVLFLEYDRSVLV